MKVRKINFSLDRKKISSVDLEKQKDILRGERDRECYIYINRGEAWYKLLSEDQIKELDIWYKAWLDVTDTFIIPEKPKWLR